MDSKVLVGQLYRHVVDDCIVELESSGLFEDELLQELERKWMEKLEARQVVHDLSAFCTSEQDQNAGQVYEDVSVHACLMNERAEDEEENGIFKYLAVTRDCKPKRSWPKQGHLAPCMISGVEYFGWDADVVENYFRAAGKPFVRSGQLITSKKRTLDEMTHPSPVPTLDQLPMLDDIETSNTVAEGLFDDEHHHNEILFGDLEGENGNHDDDDLFGDVTLTTKKQDLVSNDDLFGPVAENDTQLPAAPVDDDLFGTQPQLENAVMFSPEGLSHIHGTGLADLLDSLEPPSIEQDEDNSDSDYDDLEVQARVRRRQEDRDAMYYYYENLDEDVTVLETCTPMDVLHNKNKNMDFLTGFFDKYEWKGSSLNTTNKDTLNMKCFALIVRINGQEHFVPSCDAKLKFS